MYVTSYQAKDNAGQWHDVSLSDAINLLKAGVLVRPISVVRPEKEFHHVQIPA